MPAVVTLFANLSQVDGASWGSVEPDGLSQQPAKRKGLTGLLGLFGNLGVVGAIPSGEGRWNVCAF